ncbi:hypothetical protein [Methanocella sp. MCL-LM]|uniref:hypothetical protein n=1 Tax=Methanocella sp. MCL-LM TaxID=3412035 RepID=UPI003C796B48
MKMLSLIGYAVLMLLVFYLVSGNKIYLSLSAFVACIFTGLYLHLKIEQKEKPVEAK